MPDHHADARTTRRDYEDNPASVLPAKNTKPFAALLAMLAHHKGVLAVAIVLSVVSSVLGLAQPLMINRIIENITQRPTGLIAALIGILVLASILSGIQVYLLTRTAEAAVLNTRQQLIARLLRLPIKVYDVERTGDLVTRLGSDTTLVRTAFTGGLVNAIGAALTMIGSIILMAYIDVTMLLIVLAVIIITVAAVVMISRYIQRYTTKAQEAVGDLGAGMDRALVAVRTIRAAGAQDRVDEALDADAQRAYVQGVKIAKLEGILSPASSIALQASFLIVLGVGGARVARGDISVGDLVSFVLYMFMVSMPLGAIFSAVTTVRQAMGALQRIQQILDQAPESTAGRSAQPAQSITFDNVTFGYADTPVIRNASFHIAPGSKTALVGPSGGGKSTILALIQRFYDIESGRILLGDQDTTELSRESVRKIVGYVEQEAAVLAGTVRENLLLANPEATDEQCWEALDAVNLRTRFAEAEGLDSVLGDRGMSLSGGQRQRLSLARMLLMDTPILVLDEPTSAVDSRNEQVILDAIEASSQKCTLIIVAHRLSTVTDADNILVIDSGQVAASGTHQELLDSSDIYRDLASRQLLS